MKKQTLQPVTQEEVKNASQSPCSIGIMFCSDPGDSEDDEDEKEEESEEDEKEEESSEEEKECGE